MPHVYGRIFDLNNAATPPRCCSPESRRKIVQVGFVLSKGRKELLSLEKSIYVAFPSL